MKTSELRKMESILFYYYPLHSNNGKFYIMQMSVMEVWKWRRECQNGELGQWHSILSASAAAAWPWGGPPPPLLYMLCCLPLPLLQRSRYIAVVGCGCMCVGFLPLGIRWCGPYTNDNGDNDGFQPTRESQALRLLRHYWIKPRWRTGTGPFAR